MDLMSFLRGIPLFRGVGDEALRAVIDGAVVADAPAGARIIEAGQPGEFLGVLLEGEASARQPAADPLGDPVELGRLRPGAYFGEMALLTGELTGADVVAQGPCRYLRIPQPVFARTLAASPVALGDLARTLAARLRRRDEDPGARQAADGTWRRAEDPYRLRPENAFIDRRVLVLNCGSSSVKYALFDGSRAGDPIRGMVERIGLDDARLIEERGQGERHAERLAAPDHAAALEAVFGRLDLAARPVHAVGHRVVHGGDRHAAPAVIDDALLEALRDCSDLAPLHNPHDLRGIEAARARLPGIPHVAVFDTAFHRSLPAYAHTYGLPHDLARTHGLRRYGFHGPSHQYVALRAATHLRRPVGELRLITCHLGSGCSVCAIDHGRSVDTSTGFSTLEGLMMGTRPGDLDAGLLLHLIARVGLAPSEVERLLTRESGLRGLSGLSGDMREIETAAERGDPRALLAVQVFAYRVKKYLGAYLAALGGADAVVFTGGIGQNSPGTRARICQNLDRLGVSLDDDRNRSAQGDLADVAAEASPVRVLVVRTDEELMIGREALRALGHRQVDDVIRARERRPIPIEVSAHHIHLSQAHVERLFGEGHRLTARSELSQPGQYACAEVVDLVGPKGRVDRVRVLGPTRPETQVEISRTEEFRLGIDAPIRASGDVGGSPGVALVGPHGRVDLEQGVICALRHIHMHPEDALAYGLRDRDVVRIRVDGERSLIFGDVLVRVSPDFRLAMHIDTDEANAAEISPGAQGFLDSIQDRHGPQRRAAG